MHIAVVTLDSQKSLKNISGRVSEQYENLPDSDRCEMLGCGCDVLGKSTLINVVLSSFLADELARDDGGSVGCDVEEVCGCLAAVLALVSNSSRFAQLFS